MWGETGITRMFDASQGGQIAWLIPSALILVVLGIILRGKVGREDPQRAALAVWGLWLLVTGLTFSFMAGIFHSYYTVALAPAIAASIGAGSVLAWRNRDRYWVRIGMAAATLAAVVMAWVLLGRSADFQPWLRWTILGVGISGAVLVLIPAMTRGKLALASILAVVFAGLAGPTAYTVDTLATPHTGSIVSAGPDAGGMGGFGGGMRGDRDMREGDPARQPPGAFPGAFPGAEAFPGGGGGGLLSASTPTEAIISLLDAEAQSYTWVAAAVGSNTASGYQLATEDPVMAIGGFNGSDPSPTLAEFQQYVADGDIHYFIAGGGMGGNSTGTSSEIAEWVAANYTATTVDSVTLYDLGS